MRLRMNCEVLFCVVLWNISYELFTAVDDMKFRAVSLTIEFYTYYVVCSFRKIDFYFTEFSNEQ